MVLLRRLAGWSFAISVVWAALIGTFMVVARLNPPPPPIPHLVRGPERFSYLGLTAGQTHAPQLPAVLGDLPGLTNGEQFAGAGSTDLLVLPDMAGWANFEWGYGSADDRLRTIALTIAAAQIRTGSFILYFGQPCYATRVRSRAGNQVALVYPDAGILIKSDPGGRWNASSMVTGVFLSDSRFNCPKIGRQWTGFRVHLSVTIAP